MDCEQALSLLSAYLDGELDPSERAALEAHLATCAACRATADALRLQDLNLRRAFASRREAAAVVAERVIARLPARRSHGWPRLPWLPMLLSAAAGFLLAVVLLRPWQRPSLPTSPAISKSTTEPVRQFVELTLTTGAVEVLLPGQETWQPMGSGSRVEVGAQVRTPARVRCELHTADGSEVRLNSDTELHLAAARRLALTRGEILATVATVAEAVPFQVQLAETTVTALGTQFDLTCQPEESRLTVLEGKTQVQSSWNETVVQTGEVARIVKGRVVETRRGDDLLRATNWVQELLVLKGRNNEELARRVQDILSRIGESKTEFLSEDEIRSLGDHCVQPLNSYLCSPDSRKPERRSRRVEAARIIADLAQPSAIPDLIDLLGDEDGDVRYYASLGLLRLTRLDQGVEPETWRNETPENLKKHLQRWRDWWERNKDRYPRTP